MTGDQKNFNVYGIPTREKRPIVRMSTPSTVSQACNVPLVKARGSPEANPKGNMTANRLEARNGIKDLRHEIHIFELSVLRADLENGNSYAMNLAPFL